MNLEQKKKKTPFSKPRFSVCWRHATHLGVVQACRHAACSKALCGCDRKERFTTFERVQFQELTVIKGNGKREPFDRDKISKSIRIATRKRPIDSETIEKFISKIVRNLEGLGESEIPTPTIGKFIMDGLSALDKVAYVRFASVYKNFKEAKDFEEFVGNIDENKS